MFLGQSVARLISSWRLYSMQLIARIVYRRLPLSTLASSGLQHIPPSDAIFQFPLYMGWINYRLCAGGGRYVVGVELYVRAGLAQGGGGVKANSGRRAWAILLPIYPQIGMYTTAFECNGESDQQ